MLDPFKILGGFSVSISVSGGINSLSCEICCNGVSSGEIEIVDVNDEKFLNCGCVDDDRKIRFLGLVKNFVKRDKE